MKRLFTIVASTVVAGLVGVTLPAQAQPDGPRAAGDGRGRRISSVGIGHIEGFVRDERGAPLQGVTVSALGASRASAVSDRHGAFSLRALPAGSYFVRAQRPGYVPAHRQFVNVESNSPTRFSMTMQRSDVPGLLAAGMVSAGTEDGLPLTAAGDVEATTGGEDAGETAWRLRHLKRSILKEAERNAAIEGGNSTPVSGVQPGTLSYIARAMGTSGHLLGELSLTGQVNFLTSGSFDGAFPVLSAAMPLRQVAFVSVGGPAWGHGDWSGQVMTQGDLGSWFVAGSYRRRPQDSAHVYDVGVTYSSQRFTPGSRWPIATGSEGTRSAGTIYASDEWMLSPRARISLGARYSRYDYLRGPGLFSPRVSLTLIPLDGLRLRGAFSRRLLAPGAEEFLEPLVSGLWVPPERTFLGLSPVEAERTSHYEVAIERDLPLNYVFAVRSFYQVTGDQQVALFGFSPLPGAETGHYVVADGGNLVARGWSVGVSNMLAPYVRGSLTYTWTAARWMPGMGGNFGLLLLGPGARPASERLHDLTTAVETDIPVTATRVFVAYKLNTGFARRQGNAVPAGLGARFDVQVLQRLPFLDFTSASWQVMVGVRNLFRDTTGESSVYDELLVIRPPKRVVTGLLVRF